METRADQERQRYRLSLGVVQDLKYELPIISDVEDRFTHFYILGKSKMGKSVLMERMARYDMEQGISVIFIDPKGDSVRKLRNNQARYVSASEPIGLNPFDKTGYSLDNIIAEFVQVLDVLITLTSINPESSVRMKDLLDNAIKSFSPKQRNIKYLADFLDYEDIRKMHDYPTNEFRTYWREFDSKQGQYYKNRGHHDTAKSITSRLRQFLNSEVMSKFVLGKNEFNLPELLRSGQSLLVDTSQLRPDPRIFVSNLIIYAVATYSQYHRTGIPLIVYIDEAQTIASKLFTDVLEFGQSAKIGFNLAHHSFVQIKKEITDSMLGIISNYIVFNCGKDEGRTMADIYSLKPNDFYNLPKYQAWIRLGTDNILIETYPPFPAPDIPLKHSYLRDSWFSCGKM
jgi:hypothetical protein